MSELVPGRRNYHECQWVQVVTPDGLRLDGLLHDPDASGRSQPDTTGKPATPSPPSEPDGSDAHSSHGPRGDSEIHADPPEGSTRPLVLLLHGAGGNFYGPSLINRVGTHLFRAGWPVLRVNTRGHDGWHVAFRGGRVVPQGAAFERLEEAAWDVTAWLDWSARNGYPSVILAGHSLGAFKLLLTLAEAPRTQVTAAVAISPPCLSQRWMEASDQGAVFRETLLRCQALVAEGRSGEVLSVSYPFPMLISAGCYVNKYASGERFNFTTWLDQLPGPLLWMFGQEELAGHQALARGVETLERSLPTGHRLVMLPEADHFFTGWSREVCLEVEQWLEPRH